MPVYFAMETLGPNGAKAVKMEVMYGSGFSPPESSVIKEDEPPTPAHHIHFSEDGDR